MCLAAHPAAVPTHPLLRLRSVGSHHGMVHVVCAWRRILQLYPRLLRAPALHGLLPRRGAGVPGVTSCSCAPEC